MRDNNAKAIVLNTSAETLHDSALWAPLLHIFSPAPSPTRNRISRDNSVLLHIFEDSMQHDTAREPAPF